MIESKNGSHAIFFTMKDFGEDYEVLEFSRDTTLYRIHLPLGTGKKFSSYLDAIKEYNADIWKISSDKPQAFPNLKFRAKVYHYNSMDKKKEMSTQRDITISFFKHDKLDMVLSIELEEGVHSKKWTHLYKESFKLAGFYNDFIYLFDSTPRSNHYNYYNWSTDYTLEYKAKGDNYNE